MQSESTGVIAVLPEVVRNQIAAGEVIERPASVVKELVENSLDAGASNVRVDLEEGGVQLVRIVDDGEGMAAGDLELALTAHATSKLRGVDDLEHIASLGFRGEALASIGSVSRLRIVSRQAGDSQACSIEQEGGRRGELRAAAGEVGTTIEVRDLFFNTPARRHFLKRPGTELARVLDVVQRLALAHTSVGFIVTHGGRRVYDVEPALDLVARIRRTFGAELADSLVPVEGQEGGMQLSGYLAPPRFARRDTSRQLWFLNGRYLKDKLLIRCAREAFRGWVMDGRHPSGFLSLSLDPSRVDVNVHPTKSEVRFRDERRVFGFLLTRMKDAVAESDVATPGEHLLDSAQRRGAWSPRADAPGQGMLPDPGVLRPVTNAGGTPPPAVRAVDGPPLELEPRSTEAATEHVAERPGAGSGWEARDEIAGPYMQIAKTYLLRPLADGFEIIDQHALHERSTLNEINHAVRTGALEIQRLLVPALVELSRDEVSLLSTHRDSLAKVGVQLEPFGETTVAVQGLPALLKHPDAEGLVRDVAEHLKESGKAPEVDVLCEHVLHRMACRSSIMAGDVLTDDDIQALLERAARWENDQTCAHGRPTRVHFSLSDLEKAFHRR